VKTSPNVSRSHKTIS